MKPPFEEEDQNNAFLVRENPQEQLALPFFFSINIGWILKVRSSRGKVAWPFVLSYFKIAPQKVDDLGYTCLYVCPRGEMLS